MRRDGSAAVRHVLSADVDGGVPTLVAFRMKANLAAAATLSFQQTLDIERAHQRLAALTLDHAEARAAFLEKREPVFRGF